MSIEYGYTDADIQEALVLIEQVKDNQLDLGDIILRGAPILPKGRSHNAGVAKALKDFAARTPVGPDSIKKYRNAAHFWTPEMRARIKASGVYVDYSTLILAAENSAQHIGADMRAELFKLIEEPDRKTLKKAEYVDALKKFAVVKPPKPVVEQVAQVLKGAISNLRAAVDLTADIDAELSAMRVTQIRDVVSMHAKEIRELLDDLESDNV